jgi:thioredoxin 1
MARKTTRLLILATLFLSFCTFGATQANFTEERYIALTEANRPVLIDVHASWCPTCKRQSAILDRYVADNPKLDLTILRVDFDDQKKWVKHFKAPRQSTLVLFIGEERRWFSVAETSKDAIFATLDAELK